MYFFSLTDIPAADEINTEINYSQEDKHISASLTFQNIYPLPQCMLSVGVCLIIINLTYHQVYNQINTTGVTSGARVAHSFDLYVCFVDVVCPILFRLTIVLSVLLRYTDSDYPFGIFKLFLQQNLLIYCNVLEIFLMIKEKAVQLILR